MTEMSSDTRASGSAPSKSKTGPTDIARVIRDEEVVRLKIAGYTHADAAAAVGLASKSSVTDILNRWMDDRGPSSELVEQYRQLQARSATSSWPRTGRLPSASAAQTANGSPRQTPRSSRRSCASWSARPSSTASTCPPA
jgi:hypothetical protein